MKKLTLLLLITISFFVFNSCEDENDININYVTFETESINLSVLKNSTVESEVKIFTTQTSGSDRTFNITVDPDSSADPASYDVPTSVVVPANSNVGVLTVGVSDTNIGPNGETLYLHLVAEKDLYTGGPITFKISRLCPSDLGGIYHVISNGENTDGQPAAVDIEYTVTVTDLGNGQYTISDGYAGVYMFWYGIYGIDFEVEGNFSDSCGSLSGDWVGPFGSTAILTGTDNEDGTLTIRWSNGFGDYIDAEYTKQ